MLKYISWFELVGSPFNIPVVIGLPGEYPNVAPLIFVNPTQEMNIKTGPNVKSDGHVVSPCLEDWNKVSTLLACKGE